MKLALIGMAATSMAKRHQPDYIFQAEMITGDSSRGLPVFDQTRVQGVSFNDELGQVLVEISDGQTLALADVKRISQIDTEHKT